MEKPAEKADRGKHKKRKQEEQHFVEIRPERRKEQQEAQRPQHLEEPRLPKRIRYQAVCCIQMVYCALSTVFVSLKVKLHLFLFRNNGQSVSEDHRQRKEERGLVKEHRSEPQSLPPAPTTALAPRQPLNVRLQKLLSQDQTSAWTILDILQAPRSSQVQIVKFLRGVTQRIEEEAR